jgi:hypothetical protein
MGSNAEVGRGEIEDPAGISKFITRLDGEINLRLPRYYKCYPLIKTLSPYILISRRNIYTDLMLLACRNRIH